MGEANLFTPIVSETQETALGASRDLGALLLGKDPIDVKSRVREMRRFMPQNPTTRSAFDMALHDLAGKAADLPLYALLGGPRRVIVTDNTVGIDTPAAMVEHALELKRRGFPAVKVKVGTTPEEGVEKIGQIREAIGPALPIRIDANQGWNRAGAIKALKGMETLGVEYCEQPVPAWDHESLRDVHQQSRIPIMADESVFDEHDALRLVAMRVCDYLNIKLAKSSGIRIALRINAVAEAAGVQCMVGCMTESRLGLTAAAHLASACSNIVFADLDGADMLKEDPVIGGMIYGEKGQIHVPEEPGLGADVDPALLEELDSFSVG